MNPSRQNTPGQYEQDLANIEKLELQLKKQMKNGSSNKKILHTFADLGSLYMLTGEFEKGLEMYDEALKIKADDKFLNTLKLLKAKACFLMKVDDKANEVLDNIETDDIYIKIAAAFMRRNKTLKGALA